MRRWLSLARIGLTSTLSGGTLPVMGVVAALAVYGFGYAKGTANQEKECRTAELEAIVESQRNALERIQEQLRAANTARDNANDRAARDAAILEQAKDEADAFTQTLRDAYFGNRHPHGDTFGCGRDGSGNAASQRSPSVITSQDGAVVRYSSAQVW